MKDFDTYLERVDAIDSTRQYRYAALLSYLSTLALLGKLLTRKNNSKTPFTSSFDYEGREKQRKQTVFLIQELLDKEEDFEKILPSLEYLKETISLAKDEIKSVSLKGDFDYMFMTTDALINLVS